MKKWSIRLSILLGLLLSLIILISYVAESQFLGDSDYLEGVFTSKGISYKENNESINNHPIRWISTGNDSSSVLTLLFHGAPGSWRDFESYITDSTIISKTKIVVLDRPGYGSSDYGRAEPSIIKQQDIAHQIVDRYPQDSIIVIGYSYGGPVAGSYAARHPEKVKGILLLAPVIAPEGEKIFWFNHVLRWPIMSLILPEYINVANVEKLHHSQALQEIKDDWGKIKAPVIHMHCMDDWIAPYHENTDWAQRQITKARYTLINWEGDSHYLPNQIKDKISPTIHELLD